MEQAGDATRMKKTGLNKALGDASPRGETPGKTGGSGATGPMSVEKHVSWCRTGEIFNHQLEQWKKDVIASIKQKPGKEDADETVQLKQTIASLKEELSRKNKALAQTADLLALKQKPALSVKNQIALDCSERKQPILTKENEK